MKKLNKSPITIYLLRAVFVFLLHSNSFAWGFLAHKMINRKAVEALPAELRLFFEKHKDYLAEHSIDPDLWREQDSDEAVRHYIDIDLYGKYPFEELPRSFVAAKNKFGENTVNSRGIGPWWVVQYYDQLINSMKQGDTKAILLDAAVLGHYVADLHVPLHTTENYDGQFTGNKGIHYQFEASMIAQFENQIKLKVDKAQLIAEPLSFIFEVVLNSYQFVDDILTADSKSKKPHKTYKMRNDYDEEYYAALFAEVGALAEKQMSAAASAIASFWYSAWNEAGQPRLF